VLASFLMPFAASSVTIALPTISRELGMDAISLSWVPSIYILVSAMFLVPFGRLADIHGRKKIFLIGMTIFSIAYLLIGLAPSGALLVTFRGLQGFGGAMIAGTSISILASVYPASERGRVLGINVACVYLGLSTGPLFGGVMTEYWGWRSLFLLLFPIALLVVVVTKWKLKGEWAEARGERFDLVGSAIYSVMLLLTMYGISLLPSPSGFATIGMGATGLGIFMLWENRTKSPVLDLKLFRNNRVFAFSNLAALINYLAGFSVGFLLSLYLQFIVGFSAEQAGFVLIAQPVMQALFSPLAGRLSDKIEPRIVASSGMALTFIGLLLFSTIDRQTSLWLIIPNLMMMGLGFALFSSPNTNAVMSSVEKQAYGVAGSIISTMRLTGNMLGMGTAMLLIALFVGPVQIGPHNYEGFITCVKLDFMISAILCLIGIFASLARGKLRQANPIQ